MKKTVMAFVVLFALSFLPSNTVAQEQEPEIGWEIGWEEDNGEEPWMLSESGTLKINFWAENKDPYPLELNLEFEAELGATIDLPESINIGAQSNTSTEIEVKNVTVLDHLAGTTGDIAIIATRANPVDGSDVSLDPQNARLEGQIKVPRIADLKVELQPLGFTVTAGTTTAMEVILTNNGNMRDKVVSPTLIANGCPQLSLSGIQEIDGLLVDSIHEAGSLTGADTSAEITLSPSSSHPTKKCTIEIAVVSDGGGGTSISTQEIDIGAAQSSGSDTGTPSDGNNSDSSGSDGNEETKIISDSLPAPSVIVVTVAIISAAIIHRKDRVEI